MKSKVTSLIEQSSKSYLENKIVKQIEYGSVNFRQNRVRDNILISLKEENEFIETDQSAISELDDVAAAEFDEQNYNEPFILPPFNMQDHQDIYNSNTTGSGIHKRAGSFSGVKPAIFSPTYNSTVGQTMFSNIGKPH